MNDKNLGPRQHSVLRALIRHGVWYPGKGWEWENTSTTKSILDSLVRRGLVDFNIDTGEYRANRDGQTYAVGSYVI